MRTERRTVHFDFAHLDAATPLTFHQSLRSYPVQVHDDVSRSRARAAEKLLGLIADERLSHYVDVPDMPTDIVHLSYVTRPLTIDGRVVDAPLHMAVHVPRAGEAIAAAETKRRRGSARPRLHPKYRIAGVTLEALMALDDTIDPSTFPSSVQSYSNALDAAVALVFHHPSLINLNADNGGAVPAYIVNTIIANAVEVASDLIGAIEGNADWLTTTTYNGPPPENVPVTASNPSIAVQGKMTASVAMAIQASQDDTFLEGQQWVVEYGSTTAAYGGAILDPGQELAVMDGDTWTARTIPGANTNGFSVDGTTIVITPPPAADNWVSDGFWSINDVAPFEPLTPASLALLAAGNLYLQISGGVTMQAPLVLAAQPGDDDLTPITAAFTPVGPAPADAPAVTATLTLNSGQTGLAYSISAQGLGPAATAGFYSGSGADATLLRAIPLTDFSGMGSLSVQCTNSWLRHLSACVQYLDADGNVLTPPVWSDNVPSWLQGTFEPDPTKKFLTTISPVNTVFGVPLPATTTTLTIPLWEEVSTIRILTGGLGRGTYDPAVCPIGIAMTALCELVLPPFLLLAGAAITNSKTVTSLFADGEVKFAICTAAAFLVAGPVATRVALAQNPGAAALGLTETFAPFLLSTTTSLGAWIAGKIVQGAAEKATPFLDIAFLAINCCITAAELSQTIIEVLDSPFVYETDLVASVTVTVTLNPDPKFNKFPDDHDHFTLVVLYDVGTTLPSVTISLPPATISNPFTVSFQGAPAGGNARAYCFFYAANDWQSGQGVSDWTPVVGTDGTCAISLTVDTNEIPLTVNSVYAHIQKTALENGALSWLATSVPPAATADTPSPFGATVAVLSYSGITMTQQAEMLGLCYQAVGLNIPPNVTSAPPSNDALYMLGNLSVLQNPSLGTSISPVGFVATAGTAYNMAASEGAAAANFFIDAGAGDFAPTLPASGYHARQIVLSPDVAPAFGVASNQSFGRFPIALSRYVYHPQGMIFGINTSTHKLYILNLQSSATDDADAALATMASGQGFRDGLMSGPVGIAIALDGRVLVLEANNNRIQAFDTTGNPVPYFAGAQGNVCTMALNSSSDATYLDIAVESKGYIYVLYSTGDGTQQSDYAVDIYQPNGAYLVTTPNVAAANLVVDILRNLYTMNYETILDANNRPQPSVSMWMPPPPPPAEGAAS